MEIDFGLPIFASFMYDEEQKDKVKIDKLLSELQSYFEFNNVSPLDTNVYDESRRLLIDNSFTYACLVTETYLLNQNCRRELSYARERYSPMRVFIIMEDNYDEFLKKCYDSEFLTKEDESDCDEIQTVLKYTDLFRIICVLHRIRRIECYQAVLLHRAVWIDDLELTKYLCDQNADVNEEDDNCQTPIMLACENGSLEVFKCLYEKGATINDSEDEPIILQIAASNERLDILKYLEEKGVNFFESSILSELLERAAVKNSLELVKYLCGKGAQVDSSSLREAARGGNLDIFDYLCSKQPEILKTSEIIQNCFHFATTYQNLKIIEYLYGKNCLDLNGCGLDGKSAFILAAAKPNLDVIKFLHDKGANIFHKCVDGRNALHYAAINANKPIVDYLCGIGLNVNEKDKNGRTPINDAIESQSDKKQKIETINFLIDHGAKLNEIDSYGKMLLHNAARSGCFDTFLLLYSKNLKIDVLDQSGTSVLDEAISSNNFKLVKFIYERIKPCEIKKLLNLDIKKIIASSNLQLIEYLYHKECPILYETLWQNDNIYKVIKANVKAAKYIINKQINCNNDLSIPIPMFLKLNDNSLNVKNATSELITEIKSYMSFANNFETESIINKTFENDIICKYNRCDPHILICKLKIPCGHHVCLQCSLDLLSITENLLICHNNDCIKLFTFTREQLLQEDVTKFTFSPESVAKLLDGYRHTINHVKQDFEKVKNQLYEEYLNKISFIEDEIEIRFESIRTQFNKYEKKLKQYSTIKTRYYRKCKRLRLSETQNFMENALKCLYVETFIKSAYNMVSFNKIGQLTITPFFNDLDDDETKLANKALVESVYMNREDSSIELIKTFEDSPVGFVDKVISKEISLLKVLQHIVCIVDNMIYHKMDLNNMQNVIHKLYQFHQLRSIMNEILQVTRQNSNEELLKTLKSQVLNFYLGEKLN